jgi:hypothetical protein
MAADERGPVLLALAREAIAREFGHPPGRWPEPWLLEPGNTFVTVRVLGALHGCVGTLGPPRPLLEDVPVNARAAAFRDPRSHPLTLEAWAHADLEVSLLGPRETVAVAGERELLAGLRPGIDGLVLEYGPCRGAFLPQVWKVLPDPALFLTQLKLKAGLPADFWHPDLRASRFTIEKWREHEALAGRG